LKQQEYQAYRQAWYKIFNKETLLIDAVQRQL
jgi:hypothetical protein